MDAVIFDLDGVVVDTERIVRRSLQKIALKFDVRLTDQDYCRLLGRDEKDSLGIMGEMFGSMTVAELVNAEGLQEAHRYFQNSSAEFKYGFPELLEYLIERKTPLAVASSSPRDWVMARLGTAPARFDVIVSAESESRPKPLPDLFTVAARRLHQPPEKCLVLEDSGAGVAAAVSAGMPVIFIPDLELPSANVTSKALQVLPSLKAVQIYLQTRHGCRHANGKMLS